MKEKGITTPQLAEKLGVSVSATNQQLSGSPSLRNLENLARHLRVPLWQLFASIEEIMETEHLQRCTEAERGEGEFRCPKCGAALVVTEKEG